MGIKRSPTRTEREITFGGLTFRAKLRLAWGILRGHTLTITDDDRVALCTCMPNEPDDQCPTHGYEAWVDGRGEGKDRG